MKNSIPFKLAAFFRAFSRPEASIHPAGAHAPAKIAPPFQARPPASAIFRWLAVGAGALLAAVLCIQPALAQETLVPADSASRWGLGLGVGVERKPYRGMDNDTQAFPLLFYENKWVSLMGSRLDIKLPSAGPVSFGLRARYAAEGYEASDSPVFAGMAERKDGLWLGAAAVWRNDIATVSAELLGDASGNSKGQQARLLVERGFKSGAFEFVPRVAATWLDSKYVGYYYGVNASEATAGRAAYAGKASVNLELGLRTSYALAPRQSVFVDLSVMGLGSGIKDSPLVERSSQSTLRVGYLYRF